MIGSGIHVDNIKWYFGREKLNVASDFSAVLKALISIVR